MNIGNKNSSRNRYFTTKKVGAIALITILVAVIAVLSSGDAAGAGENLHYNQSATTDAEFSNITEKGFFAGLDSFLSFARGPETVAPGEQFEIDLEVDATKDVYTDQSSRIVEVYQCVDSGCDDGGGVEPGEDSCDKVGDVPSTADDCVDIVREPTEFPYQMDEGSSWGWTMDYTASQTEGYYTAVAYLWDSNDGGVVTTQPKHKFEVQEQTSTDTSNPEPHVVTYKTPSYTVKDSGKVVGSVGFRNNGDADMPDRDIVEMQVRPAGQGPLSFSSDYSKVCDDSHPENVHKEYSIDTGDDLNIRLETPTVLEDGKSYTVYFMTREACYPDNEKTPPIYNSYNAGTFTYTASDQGTDDSSGSESQDVVSLSKPQLTYQGGKVTTTVHLKNKGGDMPDSDIVEMQVRPQGTNPLSTVSTQKVCDSSHPENVHKEYKLASGETAEFKLSTSEFAKDKKYRVYLMTREECGGGKVNPYYNSKTAGTVDANEKTVNPPKHGLPLKTIGVGLILAALAAGGVYLYG